MPDFTDFELRAALTLSTTTGWELLKEFLAKEEQASMNAILDDPTREKMAADHYHKGRIGGLRLAVTWVDKRLEKARQQTKGD